MIPVPHHHGKRRTGNRFVVGSQWVLVGGALVATTTFHSAKSFQWFRRLHHSRSPILAHSLTTALEGLWEDRLNDGSDDEKRHYRSLLWLDLESDLDLNSQNGDGASYTDSTIPSSSITSYQDQEENMPITLPLYPLSEVYLPLSTAGQAPDTIVNHTLNNVEPQNIKMALDLLAEQSTSAPRFCVVLRALDTGRIARVGNILRIVDADVQRLSGAASNNPVRDNEGEDKIVRIRLTCQSEGLAEIVQVENGSGWGEKRLLRSDEYLRARLRPMVALDGQENDDDDDIHDHDALDWRDAYEAIRKDLRTIKLIYQLQLGSENYPPDALLKLGNAIQDFPELDDAVGVQDDGDALLWKLAQEWQSVCMTLRHGRQALLTAERNERMVAAACSYGGPLKLPIHVSDLDPESRREIQQLDEEFQQDHEVFGMDPILDFQVLLGLDTTKRRFGFLAKLVARERLRLEEVASSSH